MYFAAMWTRQRASEFCSGASLSHNRREQSCGVADASRVARDTALPKRFAVEGLFARDAVEGCKLAFAVQFRPSRVPPMRSSSEDPSALFCFVRFRSAVRSLCMALVRRDPEAECLPKPDAVECQKRRCRTMPRGVQTRRCVMATLRSLRWSAPTEKGAPKAPGAPFHDHTLLCATAEFRQPAMLELQTEKALD
jgi:hypothetical protein